MKGIASHNKGVRMYTIVYLAHIQGAIPGRTNRTNPPGTPFFRFRLPLMGDWFQWVRSRGQGHPPNEGYRKNIMILTRVLVGELVAGEALVTGIVSVDIMVLSVTGAGIEVAAVTPAWCSRQ